MSLIFSKTIKNEQKSLPERCSFRKGPAWTNAPKETPGCTCPSGSMTLEAAVVVPILACLFTFVLFFFRVMQVQLCVHLVEDSDSKDGIMKMIAAGGFKDITRIASSSAAMWQQICLTNTENIVALLDSYMDALGKIRTELVNRESDAIYDFFDGARIYRDSFINASSGPIKRAYCIHVDIADKAGALAHIVTMLAGNNISIKNVEITHNRESEDGVLRVEFYEEGSMNAAIELLQKEDYHLYLLG